MVGDTKMTSTCLPESHTLHSGPAAQEKRRTRAQTRIEVQKIQSSAQRPRPRAPGHRRLADTNGRPGRLEFGSRAVDPRSLARDDDAVAMPRD
jgi:hypothetical protein